MSLDRIVNAIKSERCLPFLGAGASASYSHNGVEVPGIPLGGRLREIVASDCAYPKDLIYDLPTVAEYHVDHNEGNREKLEGLLYDQIKGVHPRPVHTALAQLHELCFVITSNYDQLLEFELQRYGRRLKKDVWDRLNPAAGHFKFDVTAVRRPDVILHKMHGTVEQPSTMVITRSDYIHYLTSLTDSDRGMPEVFRKSLLPFRNLLFMGYSLSDWNFQVIWEGVLASRRQSGIDIDSYALVKGVEDFDRRFWAKRKVELIECDLTQFAEFLADKFNLEIPQLGISKKPGGAGP